MVSVVIKTIRRKTQFSRKKDKTSNKNENYVQGQKTFIRGYYTTPPEPLVCVCVQILWLTSSDRAFQKSSGSFTKAPRGCMAFPQRVPALAHYQIWRRFGDRGIRAIFYGFAEALWGSHRDLIEMYWETGFGLAVVVRPAAAAAASVAKAPAAVASRKRRNPKP